VLWRGNPVYPNTQMVGERAIRERSQGKVLPLALGNVGRVCVGIAKGLGTGQGNSQIYEMENNTGKDQGGCRGKPRRGGGGGGRLRGWLAKHPRGERKKGLLSG